LFYHSLLSADDLRDHFEKFGKISDATVKRDPVTGRSKGFGFVVFVDPSVVEEVMYTGDLDISGWYCASFQCRRKLGNCLLCRKWCSSLSMLCHSFCVSLLMLLTSGFYVSSAVAWYLSGARCRLAYGPADATATQCLLFQ